MRKMLVPYASQSIWYSRSEALRRQEGPRRPEALSVQRAAPQSLLALPARALAPRTPRTPQDVPPVNILNPFSFKKIELF